MAVTASVVELLQLQSPGWGGNLLRGAANSLLIAVGAFGTGLILGTGAACGKLYGGPTTRGLMNLYTSLVRAIPELILILLLYYAGSDLINNVLEFFDFDRIEINGIAAGISVLGVVQGAYATEVIRGAIQSIPYGQLEAANAFGMSFWLKFRRIIWPSMLPFAVPGLGNLWLNATKDTAILAVVGAGISELALETSQAAGNTKHYFLFYSAAAGLYLLITLTSMFVIRRLEARYSRGMRPHH